MGEEIYILLVEDCETDAFLLQRALRKAGINSAVHIVADGQHAIDYLSGIKQYSDRKLFPFPDLVILDLRMTLKDGFDVLDWIRQQPNLTGLPVVAMSSCDLPATVDRVRQLGAVAYIMKRSNLDSLGKAFQSVMGYHEQVRQWIKQGQPDGIKPETPPFFDGRNF